jgi:hypothetical protein
MSRSRRRVPNSESESDTPPELWMHTYNSGSELDTSSDFEHDSSRDHSLNVHSNRRLPLPIELEIQSEDDDSEEDDSEEGTSQDNSSTNILNFYNIVDYIKTIEAGNYRVINHVRFDKMCKRAMKSIYIPDNADSILREFIDDLIKISGYINLEDISRIRSIEEGIQRSIYHRIPVHDLINEILTHNADVANEFLELETLLNHYIQFCIIRSLHEGLKFNESLYETLLRFIFDLGYTFDKAYMNPKLPNILNSVVNNNLSRTDGSIHFLYFPESSVIR